MLKKTLIAFTIGMMALGVTTTAYAASAPSRTGYDFDGWSDSDGAQLQQNSKIEMLKGHTITAKWIPHPYTIHFERGQIKGSSGSLSGSTGDEAMIYDVEKALNANGYKQNGYTFQHWKGSDGKTYSNLQKVKNLTSEKNGKVTLTGQWKANGNTRYTVKHFQQALNGSYPTSPTKTDTLTGTTDTTVTPATAAFAGFTAPSKGTLKINGDGTSSIRYEYKRNSYTAAFAGNGGSNAASITRKYQEALGSLPTSSRTGYTFDGWYTSVSGGTKISSATTMGAGNIIYYAHWKINSYTATFNGNGGSNGAAKTLNYGAQLGTLPTPSRTGYTFDGWWTVASGGTKISNTTTMPAGNVTYYAHWKANTYTITLNGCAGKISGSTSKTMTATYGSSYSLPTPTFVIGTGELTGTFLGWYTSATGGTKWNESGTYSTAGNVTLYAHWGGEVKEVLDFGTSWVIAVRKALKWSEARTYAKALGGDLAIINTKEKQDMVRAKAISIGDVWIGCTDAAEEGVWRWVDGSLVSSGYTNWGSGEPNNSRITETGDEDCGHIYGSNNAIWNDYSAGRVGDGFLVEIKK